MRICHDHSDLLKRSYASFMASFLNDPAVFLTEDEYANLHLGRKIQTSSHALQILTIPEQQQTEEYIELNQFTNRFNHETCIPSTSCYHISSAWLFSLA